MEHFESSQIAEAEGRYAAKAFALPTDNPYPVSHIYNAMWSKGFMDELILMRTDLKVTKTYLSKKLDEISSLKREIEKLEAEVNELHAEFA